MQTSVIIAAVGICTPVAAMLCSFLVSRWQIALQASKQTSDIGHELREELRKDLKEANARVDKLNDRVDKVSAQLVKTDEALKKSQEALTNSQKALVQAREETQQWKIAYQEVWQKFGQLDEQYQAMIRERTEHIKTIRELSGMRERHENEIKSLHDDVEHLKSKALETPHES